MEKPTILVIRDTKQELINIIEKSNLPIVCLLPIVENIYEQVKNIYMNEEKKAEIQWEKEEK